MDRGTLLTLAAVLAAAAVAGSCEKPLALNTGTSLLTVAPKSATLHTDRRSISRRSPSRPAGIPRP